VFSHEEPTHSLNFFNRFDIFIHPATMVSGIYSSQKPGLNLYLTAQGQLDKDGYCNLIANPSILSRKDYFRRGSGMGFRYYARGNRDGLYFQLMPSTHFLEYSMHGSDNIREAISGKMIDVLGYIGSSEERSIYFDIGIGYGWAFFPKGYRAYSNYPYFGKKNHGLAFDINFGVNIAVLFAPFLPLLL
jgi:hypothetical protein